MKTLHPLILTARIADPDLEPFDELRKQHFPPDRNFLRAHLTMFHRLPGEKVGQILNELKRTAVDHSAIVADVAGIRHLGAGVAFVIVASELLHVHTELRSAFMPWLGGQDMQKWQPHITVQNKVSRLLADTLHQELSNAFEPRRIVIEGMDLWKYLGGPWQLEQTVLFGTCP
ncbi:2'-5' RNA ligase family protein [Rhizobium deserti]|uniref:2'-5' RNA ligase family protein n=1 Tax=Rhizobium deserti TaxID=2547961 RepID=A0A4R5UP50_9HYPH|nr:2'-5' RNA ligase family protein [Rhizobium deserti]TDK39705.1 2'-5' RNA ligase family protein [Rhizobium deserti]